MESKQQVNSGAKESGDLLVRFCWPLLVIVVCWVAFWPGFGNEFVSWDDEKIIVANTGYRGLGWTELKWMFTTVYMCHYQPLGWLSYAVDFAIWGLNPRGFFLSNLLIHSATVLCFYHLSRLLLRAGLTNSPSGSRAGAAFAAMLFAVHPLRVESVVWLSERRDVLSGLFFVLSVLCYVRYLESSARVRTRRAWYCAALLSCVASLLSKATGVGLPLVLVLLDWYPFRRWSAKPGESQKRVAFRLLREKAPFALVAAVTTLAAIYAQRQSQTMASMSTHGIAARLLVAAYALVFYLEKSAIPWGLSPLVPLPSQVDFFTFKFGGSAILMAGAAAVLFALRRRWPSGLVIASVYVVLLLPVLGLVQIGPQLVADRYSYLSCLGFAVLLGAAAIRARGALARAGNVAAVALRVAMVVVIAILCILTRRQIAVWRNSETLWSSVLKRYPDSDIAHVGLAKALGEQGKIHEVIPHLKRATELNPSWPEPHYDLGVALFFQGQFAEARRSLQKAVQLLPSRCEGWNDLGATYLQLGQLEQAQQAFERAVLLRPTFALAQYNLAQLLARSQRHREAIEHLRLAVSAAPESTTFLENLAWLLATCPEDSLRNGSEAVRLAEQACRQTGYRSPGCLDALAAAYANVDQYEPAIQAAEQASDLARRAGQIELAKEIELRLELYRDHRPYRATASTDHK